MVGSFANIIVFVIKVNVSFLCTCICYATLTGWKQPVRLYGALVHGEFSAAYVYPAHLPGGTNVMIEVIHRTLTKYMEGDEVNGIPKQKLPRFLDY